VATTIRSNQQSRYSCRLVVPFYRLCCLVQDKEYPKNYVTRADGLASMAVSLSMFPGLHFHHMSAKE
jgi:hypothetical protein